MNIIRGYVGRGGRPGVVQVCRRDGGFIHVLTRHSYKYGQNVVVEYDPLRQLAVGIHTMSEWEARQEGVDLNEVPPEEEEDSCIPGEWDLE